jgi:hypothetical protein
VNAVDLLLDDAGVKEKYRPFFRSLIETWARSTLDQQMEELRRRPLVLDLGPSISAEEMAGIKLALRLPPLPTGVSGI